MKNTNLQPSLITLFLTLIFFQFSCNSKKTEANTATEAKTEEIHIPELKKRTARLGSEKEETLYRQKFEDFSKKVNKNPADYKSWLSIAEIFIAEARITGDHPYYYPAALEVLNNVLSKNPEDKEILFRALSLKASVQLSFHQFQEGLETAKKAVEINPHNANIYGALVDANVELGNYEEAVKMADKMVSTRPDLQSYSRVSYLREIHGDHQGAIEAMNMAVKAGYPGYEATAWARYTLGKIYETYGDLPNAKMNYTIALQERPNYAFAMEGLASVEMKKKNYEEAEKIVKEAIAIIPEVSFYEGLAEVYMATNRTDEAIKLSKEILEMMAEDEASGHKMDLEKAKVYLHILNKPEKGAEFAQVEYQKRPNNIDVNLLMGQLALAQNNYDEAEKYLKAASITNSKKPELLMSLGLIEMHKGNKKEAQKLYKQAFSADPYLSGDLAEKAKKDFSKS